MFIDWIRITLKFRLVAVTGVNVYLNSTATRCRLLVIGICCRRFAGRTSRPCSCRRSVVWMECM